MEMSQSCCWERLPSPHLSPVHHTSLATSLVLELCWAGSVCWSNRSWSGFLFSFLIVYWAERVNRGIGWMLSQCQEKRERREKREEDAAELPSTWKGVWAWNIKSIRVCPSNLGSLDLIAEACTWNMDVYPALCHQTEIYQKSALSLMMIIHKSMAKLFL